MNDQKDTTHPQKIKLEDRIFAVLVVDTPQMKLYNIFDFQCAFCAVHQGQLLMFSNQLEGMPVWTVDNVFLREQLRHRGLMRKLIRELVPHYGRMCSSIKTVNSHDAVKMWLALGAVPFATNQCDTSTHVFLLEATSN